MILVWPSFVYLLDPIVGSMSISGLIVGSGLVLGIVVVEVLGGYVTGSTGTYPEELKTPNSPNMIRSIIKTATNIIIAQITFFRLALRWCRSASDNCFLPFATFSVACSTLWAILLTRSPCWAIKPSNSLNISATSRIDLSNLRNSSWRSIKENKNGKLLVSKTIPIKFQHHLKIK